MIIYHNLPSHFFFSSFLLAWGRVDGMRKFSSRKFMGDGGDGK